MEYSPSGSEQQIDPDLHGLQTYDLDTSFKKFSAMVRFDASNAIKMALHILILSILRSGTCSFLTLCILIVLENIFVFLTLLDVFLLSLTLNLSSVSCESIDE